MGKLGSGGIKKWKKANVCVLNLSIVRFQVARFMVFSCACNVNQLFYFIFIFNFYFGQMFGWLDAVASVSLPCSIGWPSGVYRC